MGVVAIFMAGWILDWLWGGNDVVTRAFPIEGQEIVTELDAYVYGMYNQHETDMDMYKMRVQQDNEDRLERLLLTEPLTSLFNFGEEEIPSKKVLAKVKDEYKEKLEDVLPILKEGYERQKEEIDEDDFEDRIKDPGKIAEYEKTLAEKEINLKAAYWGLFSALTEGKGNRIECEDWINTLVQMRELKDEDLRKIEMKSVEADKKRIRQTVALAQAYQVAEAFEGQGIFETMESFTVARLHKMISAVFLERDFEELKLQVNKLMLGMCWFSRYHQVYAGLFILIKLAIMAIVGGAICRMTALQFAREERIGPWRALQYSLGRFGKFLMAPVFPILIVLGIMLITWALGYIGAVPGIGEVLAGICLGLGLVGGFIVALVLVGLVGGFNLMYPTIAVEGSDSFDAISRSFSYVYSRPWRLGFYSFLGAIYGSVCYVFVRLFIFLVLMVIRGSLGYYSINSDGSSAIIIRGKLDAIWSSPTFANLQPEVNWLSLNGTETLGAVFIWIWVALMTGLVLAFVVSFYFSVNTVIYFLMRQRVDATSLEEVFVEEGIEDLFEEEKTDVFTEGAGAAESEATAESKEVETGEGGEADVQEDTKPEEHEPDKKE
jgi:hypothetical protein